MSVLLKFNQIQSMLQAAQRWQQALTLLSGLVQEFCRLLMVLSWPRLWGVGAALYLLLPFLPTPWWQFELLLEQPSAQAKLKVVSDFHQQQGDAMLPALAAQLKLDRLSAIYESYQAENKEFSSQSRDQHWAEATEFLIKHLADNQPGEPLPLQDIECRNTLCRLEVKTSAGLTPVLQQRVLKLAASLKTADLEFQDLTPGRTELVLLFKSSKALKLGFFAERKLNPAEKALWLSDIKHWLYPTASAESATPAGAKP